MISRNPTAAKAARNIKIDEGEAQVPTVKPFKAVRYNQDKIHNISSVVAPPYDVIPKKMQNELYRKNRYNIVRLILNKITPRDTADNNRYTRSKKFFDTLLAKNILTQDDTDSFYIYLQKYKQGKKSIEQLGFIGLMALEMGEKDKVLPHESTLVAPKQDRLSLMRSVRANLSPIFILHDDNRTTKALKNFCARNKAVIDIKREGVRHMVWRVDDPAMAKTIEGRMKDRNVFIADGHHRYEVAKMYSNEVLTGSLPEKLKENSRYLMIYFVEADEDMLTVLPTHRLIKKLGKIKKDDIIDNLKESFAIEKVPGLNKMMSALECLADSHVFGIYLGKGNFYVLRLKDIKVSDRIIKNKPEEWKRLDVSILHLFIFQHILGISDTDENIDFLKSPVETAKAVDDGRFKAAFFLNPTKVSQVKRIARLGERMPRKSTYFYPKPLSGLVINKH